ncbi:methionine--tRNA ligase subunit beta [Candidatus Parvarchaeota archaeon]|uniref:Methionine--tRNA ligase n=1 Tax=Candidatus Acidifodinimicrobium mancum TaxID=2898728 RepID=A0A8T3UZ53_9ARCH|nr:methionine--tRNA ligase subunit beta [Candidatus Acidifodinimicrobium mancum]
MEEDKISIDEFRRIKLRVGKVISAEEVENSSKLLKLVISFKDEQRQVVAGIKNHYKPEELVGKKLIVVFNLKPAKLMGLVSDGMILAASDGEKLSVLTVDKDIDEGSYIS